MIRAESLLNVQPQQLPLRILPGPQAVPKGTVESNSLHFSTTVWAA